MAAQRRPVTPGMFASLVADLRAELGAATPEQRAALLARPRRALPVSFTGRSWVRQHASLREIAELSGLAYSSLRVYAWRGDKARGEGSETHRTMSAQAPTGGWIIGQIALWAATRDENRAKGERRRWPSHERYHPAARAFVEASGGSVTQRALALELGISPADRRLARAILREIGAAPPRRPTNAEVMPFLTGFVAQQEDRRATRAEITAALDQAGLHVWPHRAATLYHKAGGRVVDRTPPEDETLGPLESLRWDKKVTQAQIARAYGVSEALVRQAREAGRIWPVDPEAERLLYDPALLTHRKDMHAGPVMRGHPLAAEDKED
jgi:hypothetical protein